MSTDKQFLKIKRSVLRRFPNATVKCIYTSGTVPEIKHFAVCDSNGHSVVDPELLIPPATTVRKAWENAQYCGWFSNMIRKSNAAFCEEKIYRKLARERGDD